MRAQIRFLPDGRRLHLRDGPIDLIIEGFGHKDEIHAAYEAAARRFVGVLDELCEELSLLQKGVSSGSQIPRGPIAKTMVDAVLPYAADIFITPMAAVAGAVAENILLAMTKAAKLERAYVNNGGDIALYLGPQQHFTIGMIDRPDRPSLFGTASVKFDDPIRGIATSGWRGRSFSLGIADAATVLSESAAHADAAATMIANAVDLPGHASISRIPARALDPNSDLGNRLVTQAVGELSASDVNQALESGQRMAESLVERSLIHSAALRLQGETRIVTCTEVFGRRLVNA